jgi:hypothetical protein
VQAVENTTPQPASSAPAFGNFYTVTHGESWPPLPGDAMGLDLWDLGSGCYLLDDRNFDYNASRAEFGFGGPFPTNGGSAGNGGSGPGFTPQVYTTNDLWLEITNLVGSNATLLIHPPAGVTAGVYDVLTATNLTQPIQWQWWLRTDPGQTNLPISIGTNAGTFYALGKPNDFVANDSLGTNFWLAFPDMYSNGISSHTLYITSPFGASGTVTIQGESNGPTLVATGMDDDPDVNGTYILTNVTIYTTNYGGNGLLLHNGLITNAYVNGSMAIFFDENAFDGMGWALANTVTSNVLYAGPYGDYNLNNVFWAGVNDANSIIGPVTTCAAFPLVQAFTVMASNAATVPIPNDVTIINNDVVGTGYAINVAASAPVSVYAVFYYAESSAAFTAYPTTFLGTNYCVLSRPAPIVGEAEGNSELAITATADGTVVSITPSETADISAHAGPYSTNLDAGQTYQVMSADATGDVTGTWISATKPIAVFAGATVANVPDLSTRAGNPLIQEQIPVEDWGTNVLALSFAGRNNGDTYRILGITTNTVVFVTGTVINITSEPDRGPWAVVTTNETFTTNIDAGKSFDIQVDGPVQFQADKPIQVAQFANGTYADALPNGEGDPCEILLVPTDRYLETNIVVSLPNDGIAGDFDKNYLTIIVPQSATNSTTLDSAPVTGFVPIGASGYYGSSITLTSIGKHIVRSSQPACVQAYGWGFNDAYGYSGGFVK